MSNDKIRRKRCPECQQLKLPGNWMIVKVDNWEKHKILCPECSKKYEKAGDLVVNY